ncbi:MAG: FkbM family methyltransferase [Candidatus Omnitrophota bacterium]
MNELLLYKYRLKLHRILENFLGFQIFNISRHGHRDYADMKHVGHEISVIFDVGANVGQSAYKFSSAFPKAVIHCFEPTSEAYKRLKINVKGMKNIICHQIPLGSRNEVSKLYLAPQSVSSSLIKPDCVVGEEVVNVCKLDDLALENRVEKIDLLKIDTEGFDLEVLKGANEMLSSCKVVFILVEVGFHPGDKRHVLFDDVRSYLLPKGYSVFGFYEQQLEWSGESRLRYANVCFVNEQALSKVKTNV